jgi:hypothetical protein
MHDVAQTTIYSLKPAEQMRAAIVAAASDAWHCTAHSQDTLSLQPKRKGWLRAALHGLPHSITITLIPQESGCQLQVTRRDQIGCQIVSVGLALASAALLGILLLLPTHYLETHPGTAITLVGCWFVLAQATLSFSLRPVKHVQEFFEHLQQEVGRNSFVALAGKTLRLSSLVRFLAVALAVVILVGVVLCAILFCARPFFRNPMVPAFGILVLLSFATLGYGIIKLARLPSGGEARSLPCWPGFHSQLALAELSCAIALIFVVLAPPDLLARIQRLLANPIDGAAKARTMCVGFLSGYVAMLLVAAYFAKQAIRATTRAADALRSMRATQALPGVRAAVSSPAAISILRKHLTPLWLSLFALIAINHFLVLSALFGHGDEIENMSVVLSVAIAGRLPTGSWDYIAIALFGAHAIFLTGLWIISLFHLIITRLCLKRSLRAGERIFNPSPLRAFLDKRGLQDVVLVITQDASIFAAAHTFGVFRRERFIEITSTAVAEFTGDQVLLLVAHEACHHIHDDPIHDTAIRYAGRVTLVGDTFARLFQDSFANEQRAYEFAVQSTGATPDLLDQTLRGMGGFNSIRKTMQRLDRPVAAAPSQHEEKNISAFQLFLRQYTDPDMLAYWHPLQYEPPTASIVPQTVSSRDTIEGMASSPANKIEE